MLNYYIVDPRNPGLEEVTAGSSRTRRLFSKAATSEDPRAYPLRYMEGLNDARTLQGKRCV